MGEAEIYERLARIEERSKSNTHQIEELKPVVNEIHSLSKTMVELIGECKHTNEVVADVKDTVVNLRNKVDSIENAPSQEWSKLKWVVITALASTVVSTIVTSVIANMM